MGNTIDFKALKASRSSAIAEMTTIYSKYTPFGEPFLMDATEVESITIERNEYDSANDAVQRQVLNSRHSTMAMQMQVLFNQNRKKNSENTHLNEYRLHVVFGSNAARPGDAYFGIADEMKKFFEGAEPKLKIGMTLNAEDVALQYYTHPSEDMKDILLAHINVQ